MKYLFLFLGGFALMACRKPQAESWQLRPQSWGAWQGYSDTLGQGRVEGIWDLDRDGQADIRILVWRQSNYNYNYALQAQLEPLHEGLRLAAYESMDYRYSDTLRQAPQLQPDLSWQALWFLNSFCAEAQAGRSDGQALGLSRKLERFSSLAEWQAQRQGLTYQSEAINLLSSGSQMGGLQFLAQEADTSIYTRTESRYNCAMGRPRA